MELIKKIMKIIKKIFIFICVSYTILSLCVILLLYGLYSGFFFRNQSFICNVEEVSSIQIVRLEEYVEEEYQFEYNVLAEISDLDTFVNRLKGIEHSTYFGTPSRMKTGDVVVRIDYHDGNYDLIHHHVQWFNHPGQENGGCFAFDKEQFEALISDYVTE